MDKQKIDLYLTTNAKYFEPSAIPIIRQKLEKTDDTTFLSLQATDLKDPTTMLLFSLFLGAFGVDRFMLGDTGMGILKLLTLGCCGIMTIIDWFTIIKKTRQNNIAKIIGYLDALNIGVIKYQTIRAIKYHKIPAFGPIIKNGRQNSFCPYIK